MEFYIISKRDRNEMNLSVEMGSWLYLSDNPTALKMAVIWKNEFSLKKKEFISFFSIFIPQLTMQICISGVKRERLFMKLETGCKNSAK